MRFSSRALQLSGVLAFLGLAEEEGDAEETFEDKLIHQIKLGILSFQVRQKRGKITFERGISWFYRRENMTRPNRHFTLP